MSEIQFTQLHISELMQDTAVEGGVLSSGSNIAFNCSNNKLVVLDFVDSSIVSNDMAYNIYHVKIPQNYVYGLFNKAKLKQAYITCTLLEQQGLALDSSCILHFSSEPLKVNALHFKLAPWNSPKEPQFAVIVTTAGLCQIIRKMLPPNRYWSHICNVNEYFVTNSLLPMNDNHNYSFLKKCIHDYWINAATWHTTERILFVAFANGSIVGVKYDERNADKLQTCLIGETRLENICDINSFENFLLVSSKEGTLQLFHVNQNSYTLPSLIPLTYLWSKRDHIVCTKIKVNNFLPNMHLVLLNKGSHILVYGLSTKGVVLCNAKCYVGGIKVTGLEFISASEFVVTTITGVVHYLRVTVLDNNEIEIENKIIRTNITPNVQILSVVSSINRALWSFILIRSKEYAQQTKHISNSVFVNISKIKAMDSLERLRTLTLTKMNPYRDYVILIRMNILNNLDYERYSSFFDIINDNLPEMLDDAFMQKLQIKYLLVLNYMHFQRQKQKKNKQSLMIEYKLLSKTIQITHIICRLKHLCSLEPFILSSFQQEIINLLINKCILLMKELKRFTEGSFAEHTIGKYLTFFTNSLTISGAHQREKCIVWNEKCLQCNELTNSTTLMCCRNHKVKRCYVSYVQLPIVTARHCPRCQHYVLEDEAMLEQLFAPHETVKCTFCRYLFVEDDI